jgi:hypothetical protein
VLTRIQSPADPHLATIPLPARNAAFPRAWVRRRRRRRAAAAAGARARGVRLRGLTVESGDGQLALVVVRIERDVPLASPAPSIDVTRGAGRVATITLRDDALVRRNDRRTRLSGVRVGDLVRAAGGADAARVLASDPWHGRRSSPQGTSTILPRVCRRSSSR